MVKTSVVLDRIGATRLFDRSGLQVMMEECGYQTSRSIANHMLETLLTTGDVVRVGRNKYCVSGSLKIYNFPYSELAVSLADEIIKDHPYLDFRIFELVQLNEFVNHQIAHNIVFVSVERDLEDAVFNTLWERHKGSVLIKPKAAELFRYLNDDMVVIMKLSSESPKGIDGFWKTRLEKMLVDIAVDKLIRQVVYAGEYSTIYKDSFSKYAIDRNMMFRYARRRGALEKYKEFLINEAGLKQEDLKL